MEGFIADISYLCSDLISGKSLPLLTFISTTPLDPNLLGLVIFLGVTCGCTLTFIQAQLAFYKRWIFLGWFLRIINHLFSLFMSIMFLFRIYPELHELGLTLCIYPMFVLLIQNLPEKPSTTFILLILSVISFALSIIGEWEQPNHDFYSAEEGQTRLAKALSTSLTNNHNKNSQTITSSVSNCIQIFFLSLYASTQHGRVDPGSYLSPLYTKSFLYGIWITLTSGMTRSYIYLRIGWVHTNAIHLLLSKDPFYTPQKICAFTLAVCVLFSAAWTASQLFSNQKLEPRMRWTVLIMAFSFWYDWRSDAHIFFATYTIIAINLAFWGAAQITAL